MLALDFQAVIIYHAPLCFSAVRLEMRFGSVWPTSKEVNPVLGLRVVGSNDGWSGYRRTKRK